MKRITDNMFTITMIFLCIVSAANLYSIRRIGSDFSEFKNEHHRALEIGVFKVQSVARMVDLIEIEIEIIKQRIAKLERESHGQENRNSLQGDNDSIRVGRKVTSI